MSINQPQSESKQVIEVSWIDRWFVYHRLQELEIPCQCSSNQPLQVEVNNTISAIQLWSISKQLTGTRQDLINWLNQCWQKSV